MLHILGYKFCACLLFSFFKMYQILMAAGDTFRAATSDQLEIWGERTVCEIVVAE